MRKIRYNKTYRLCSGQAIADGVGALYALFVLLAFPMMCMASMTYRVILVYYATRDACYQAAKSTSFTNAQSASNTAFTNDLSSYGGITNFTQTTSNITQPLAGGASTPSTNKLGSYNTNTNVYFIQVNSSASISPLFTMPGWGGMNIPGLTGPYNCNFSYECYAENPQGLVN